MPRFDAPAFFGHFIIFTHNRVAAGITTGGAISIGDLTLSIVGMTNGEAKAIAAAINAAIDGARKRAALGDAPEQIAAE
jgi:hypothetical protein